VLNTDAVPVADDARRLAEQRADGSTPLDHALSDGEDFELILAVPADEARRMLHDQPLAGDCPNFRVSENGTVPFDAGTAPLSTKTGEGPLAVRLTDIGEFVAEPGLWQIARSGVRRPLVPQGWQHS